MTNSVIDYANTHLVEVTPGTFETDAAVPTLATPFATLACPEAAAITAATVNATAAVANGLNNAINN